VTNLELSSGLQHVSNEVPVLNTSNTPCVDDNSDDIINIQILYDPDSVKIEEVGLGFILFFLLVFIFFLIYFSIFYF